MAQRRIIWIPTLRCHLQCRYCGYVEAIKGAGHTFSYFPGVLPYTPTYALTEREPAFWVQALGRHGRALIDVSGGGEPTMYRGLPDVVEALPEQQFYLTSNLLGPFDRLLALENFIHVTASYHYLEPMLVTRAFWQKADRIRVAGKGINVTLVAFPATWKAFIAALAEVKSRGFPVNVHPYYAPGFSWAKYPELLTELRELAAKENIVAGLHEWRGGEIKGPRLCQAGLTEGPCYGPDGRRFRCLSHLHQNLPMAEGAGGDGYCDTPCLFPCDWDAPKVPTNPRMRVA